MLRGCGLHTSCGQVVPAMDAAGAGARGNGGYPPPPRRAMGTNGAQHAKGRPSPFAREQGKSGQGLASRPQQARSRIASHFAHVGAPDSVPFVLARALVVLLENIESVGCAVFAQAGLRLQGLDPRGAYTLCGIMVMEECFGVSLFPLTRPMLVLLARTIVLAGQFARSQGEVV